MLHVEQMADYPLQVMEVANISYFIEVNVLINKVVSCSNLDPCEQPTYCEPAVYAVADVYL